MIHSNMSSSAISVSGLGVGVFAMAGSLSINNQDTACNVPLPHPETDLINV